MLGRRALSAGRLAALGATLAFHHGLLGTGSGQRRRYTCTRSGSRQTLLRLGIMVTMITTLNTASTV